MGSRAVGVEGGTAEARRLQKRGWEVREVQAGAEVAGGGEGTCSGMGGGPPITVEAEPRWTSLAMCTLDRHGCHNHHEI